MKSLDIIVRTHDKSNISKFPRFISVSKRDVEFYPDSMNHESKNH
jgi:hypothetical protein